MHAIGIDIGTTSICGVLIDGISGMLLKQKTIESRAFICTENVWEKIQDVSKIVTLAKAILEELLDDETIVIGLTGQMHGILYTDREGKAVSPLYTWQDERGNLPYKDTTYAAYMDSYTGYGHVTDFYNRINGLRPLEAVSFCTIQDYLGMELCALKRPVIHTSDMASFGKPCAGDASVWEGETVTGYEVIGEYKGIPVAVAIGDNQAGVFSTLANEEEILVNVGTGSQVTLVSDKPVEGEGIEVRPYVEGKYLIVGAALCGGRAYAVLKDFYSEVLQAAGVKISDIYGLMEKMMDEEKEVHTPLYVDTRFAGTREHPEVRGSITGISEENFRPGLLVQGVLRGMAEELYGMYQSMNLKRKGLVGSGNGIRKNRKLIETVEECFKETLKIPAHKEEAAYGAALFGLVACGKYKNGAEVQKLIRYED